MVALTIKIILIAIFLVFIDLFFSPLLPDGGVTIQGETFTVLSLIYRIYEILVAFLVLIVHILTHLLQFDVVVEDIRLLAVGVIAIVIWVTEGLFTFILHLVSLPFLLVSLVLGENQLAMDFDFLNLDVVGIYVNFETLTFQVNISPLPVKKDIAKHIKDMTGIYIVDSGFSLQMKNVISFSLLPTSSGLDLFGNPISPYAVHSDALGIVLEMKDLVSTDIPLIGYVEIGVNTQALGIREISLGWVLNQMIDALDFLTPVEWMGEVYSWVIPAISSFVISGSNLSFFIEIQRYKLVQVIFNCQKIKVMVLA